MAPAPETRKGWSGKLLIGIGFLWLLLAVGLLVYQLAETPTVEIAWETATEQDTVGFNVFRSFEPNGEFLPINSDQFIDSEGGPVSGAQYTFIDQNVEAGETYYYILEEIESDGRKNRYTNEILQYSVPDNSWWAIGLAICSAIFGLAMIGLGLKENRKQ